MVGFQAWGDHGKGSAVAAIVSGAPAASLARSGTSALPGESALLSSEPVVRLSKLAVVKVISSIPVVLPVALPDHLGVVEVEEVELVSVILSGDESNGSDGELHFNNYYKGP